MSPQWIDIREGQSYMVPDGKGIKQWAWISEHPDGYLAHIPSHNVTGRFSVSLMDSMNYIEDMYEQS